MTNFKKINYYRRLKKRNFFKKKKKKILKDKLPHLKIITM